MNRYPGVRGGVAMTLYESAMAEGIALMQAKLVVQRRALELALEMMHFVEPYEFACFCCERSGSVHQHENGCKWGAAIKACEEALR
jgi:hypothetical protein